MKDFNEMTREEKHIFVWIQYIYLEFGTCAHYHGYTNFINNYIVPIKIMFRESKYKEIIEKCPEVLEILKDLLGHHYHMWLFIELKKLLQEIIS